MIRRLCLICIFTLLTCITSFHVANAVDINTEIRGALAAPESLTTQNPIAIELLGEDESIQAGRPFWLAVRLNLKDQWHAYWKNPGDAGFPTTINWTLPAGFEVGEIEWPFPSRFEVGSSIAYGYEKEAWLLVPITPPKDLTSSTPVSIKADIRWLVCSEETCLPGDSKVEITLPITSSAPQKKAALESEFAQARAKLPKKEWSVSAEKKNDGIALTLTPLNDRKTTLTHAYFCEEENCFIDHKQKNLLTKRAGEDGDEYTLYLKTSSLTEFQKAQWLKGVLVIYNEKDQDHTTQAIDINIMMPNLPKDYIVVDNTEAVHDSISSTEDIHPASHNEWEGGVPLAILFAFIGGMILNLMPCVLPVISFKVLSFVKMAGQSRTLTFKHGLAFSFGVLASFWTLAGALLALQSYGHLVGWGFQLQEPIFVGILAAVLVVFSLSLFGVFELGTMFASWAGQITSKSPEQQNTSQSGQLFGSFCSGILATAVATPCTGPFLGSALGFAVTLAPLPAMMVFTSLGLGMALPYLLLSAFPSLLRMLPKPGNWMVTFKELMGFFMLATVLWLVWVFGAQTDEMSTTLLLAGFLFLSMGCWIFGKWGSPINKKTIRLMSYGCALLFLMFGSVIIVKAATSDPAPREQMGTNSEWEPYSSERIAELQKLGIPILVDFTAKWCLICQTNHMVLISPEVSQRLDQLGVVRMKADWTRNDSEITKALREFGRSGVPLYVVYGADTEVTPHILPQVLTADIVLDHLDKVDKQIASRK